MQSSRNGWRSLSHPVHSQTVTSSGRMRPLHTLQPGSSRKSWTFGLRKCPERSTFCSKSRTLGLIRPQFHRRASVCALDFLCEFGCPDWLLPVCRTVCWWHSTRCKRRLWVVKRHSKGLFWEAHGESILLMVVPVHRKILPKMQSFSFSCPSCHPLYPLMYIYYLYYIFCPLSCGQHIEYSDEKNSLSAVI